MRVVWTRGPSRTREVLDELEGDHAYTTIQTVLNRLASQGLLTREKSGSEVVFSAGVSEQELLKRSLSRTLEDASPDARMAAIGLLVQGLSAEERAEVEDLARQAREGRGGDGD